MQNSLILQNCNSIPINQLHTLPAFFIFNMVWYAFMSVNVFTHFLCNPLLRRIIIYMKPNPDDTCMVLSKNIKSPCCPQLPIPSPRNNHLSQFLFTWFLRIVPFMYPALLFLSLGLCKSTEMSILTAKALTTFLILFS